MPAPGRAETDGLPVRAETDRAPIPPAGAYRLVRPLLFALPAEAASSVGHAALRLQPAWERVGPGPVSHPRLAVRVGGLTFPNPIGLAPGFDKDGDLVASTMHLGFGFVTVGSVMAGRRAGNPRPRLARIAEEEALLNSMGLPSHGLAHARSRLAALRDRRVPVVVDVLGTTPDEILANVDALEPYADVLQVSLECPNTGDTDANKASDSAARIARHLAGRNKPVFVKIPLHVRAGSAEGLDRFLDLCTDVGVTGLVVSGARHVRTSRLQLGHGQMGGRPVLDGTLDLVRRVRAHIGDSPLIVASGGIFTGGDALEALRAGATLIQVYSALVYRGWTAPAQIARELLARL